MQLLKKKCSDNWWMRCEIKHKCTIGYAVGGKVSDKFLLLQLTLLKWGASWRTTSHGWQQLWPPSWTRGTSKKEKLHLQDSAVVRDSGTHSTRIESCLTGSWGKIHLGSNWLKLEYDNENSLDLTCCSSWLSLSEQLWPTKPFLARCTAVELVHPLNKRKKAQKSGLECDRLWWSQLDRL